jgi:hypothetical protein
MFANKTYRHSRWIDRILRIASPTTFYKEFRHIGAGHPNVPEWAHGWCKVDSDYLVSVKRDKWITVKYVRMGRGRKYRESVMGNIKHLECVADMSLSSPVMKVYRRSDVFVHRLIPMVC